MRKKTHVINRVASILLHLESWNGIVIIITISIQSPNIGLEERELFKRLPSSAALMEAIFLL